mgnify:CR=1 FL=1
MSDEPTLRLVTESAKVRKDPKWATERFKSGENPRSKFGRKHKERGPVRYYYTVEQVAKLVGLTRVTVQRHISAGKIDMTSLESVTSYISARSSKLDPSRAQLLLEAAAEIEGYTEDHKSVLEPSKLVEARARVTSLRSLAKTLGSKS